MQAHVSYDSSRRRATSALGVAQLQIMLLAWSKNDRGWMCVFCDGVWRVFRGQGYLAHGGPLTIWRFAGYLRADTGHRWTYAALRKDERITITDFKGRVEPENTENKTILSLRSWQ